MSDNPVEKDPPRAPCYEYQNDHISAEEFFEQIDATPNDVLQDLVEEWRAKSDESHTVAQETAKAETGSRRFPEGLTVAYQLCADELEELINES